MAISLNRFLAHEGTGFSTKAIEILRTRLKQSPNDRNLWRKLGDLQRQAGDINASANTFAQLAQFEDAEEKDLYLSRMLAGKESSTGSLDYPNLAYIPTPFIRVLDFLTDEELDLVWEQCDLKLHDACNSVVGPRASPKINNHYRRSMIVKGPLLGGVRNLFRARIATQLDDAYEWFGIERPLNARLKVELTSHSNGEYYSIHRDSGGGYDRYLSYVYYFHELPRKFSGGQLHLYDTDTTQNIYLKSFTSIDPTHNSLIIFPSEYFHQVCKVTLSSNRRREGRFTLNGWHEEYKESHQT